MKPKEKPFKVEFLGDSEGYYCEVYSKLPNQCHRVVRYRIASYVARIVKGICSYACEEHRDRLGKPCIKPPST